MFPDAFPEGCVAPSLMRRNMSRPWLQSVGEASRVPACGSVDTKLDPPGDGVGFLLQGVNHPPFGKSIGLIAGWRPRLSNPTPGPTGWLEIT